MSKDKDNIQIINEGNSNIVTFSNALLITLSGMCTPVATVGTFQKKEDLAVPYSTIKVAKSGRNKGCREVVYKSSERPDLFSHVQSSLELWGFDSYLDYLYTICELGFLEGLVPVINLGFLTPDEIEKLTEVAALIKVPIDTMDDYVNEVHYTQDKEQRILRRIRNIEWAGKLGFPTVTGYVVGRKDLETNHKEWLHYIAEMHQKYGMIHEVVLHNFCPVKGISGEQYNPSSKKEMLNAVALAKSILPEDIPIIVPLALNQDIKPFLKMGIRDLGSIFCGYNALIKTYPDVDMANVLSIVESMDLVGQERFPLRRDFILAEKYSKKLGQVFEAYRYKLKKNIQEKVKETKA
jgi:7,8-didemethyl-8-hydroxy-5-deazariboflavin synthase CofG subunit